MVIRQNAWRRQNWKVILILVIITGLLSSPIYYQRIAFPVDSDYGSHVLFTQQLLDGQGLDSLNLSHPIIQLLLASMHLASSGLLGLYASLMVLQVLVQIATALIIYFWLGAGDRKAWDWLRAFAAISLTFVAPVVLLALEDGLFYYGYITLANYHNPTIHLLKPFAMLSFILAAGAVSGRSSTWKQVALAAVLIILSALAKPNYALSILPTLGLLAAVRLLRRAWLDWKMLLGGFFLPGVLILFVQWLIAYYYGDPGEQMILAPFQVEGAYSDYLPIKFFLSTLFPILILLIARSEVIRDEFLLVGWVGFLCGAVQYYLLAEGGERIYHANFRWSGQIMLFLLFVVSVRWFLREKLLTNSARLWEKLLAYGSYLAHLAGGVTYYVYCMISVHYR